MSQYLLFILLLLALFLIGGLWWWFKEQLHSSQRRADQLQQELQRQRAKQQQLDVAKTDAETANLAKNRYLSGISHELRTPLNVIMGYAQLLEQQAEDGDDHKAIFALMRHNCEHLAHLIDGILEFSAIESGKLKVQFEPFDLKALINQLNLMFKTQAEQQGLDFITQQTAHLPQTVKSDQKRLQQILINLLSNAIKFTTEGQIEFNISYRNQVATFTIKDTGCGIAEQDLQRIFEPFERIEQQQIKGTGLGLAITQLLVELLGGELTVRSQINHGSEFTFRIMLAAHAAAKQPTPEQPNQQQSSLKHLLVVDDESSHRSLLHDMLSPHGFQLSLAADATQAQHMFQHNIIDLAILDVAMPGMDGWQLASWIRTHHNSCKILMLSANPRDMEQSQNHPHDAYLTKPFKVNQLLSHLNQLLHLGWQQPQPQQHKPMASGRIILANEQLTALLNMAEIGHINGIATYLEKMYAKQALDEQQYHRLSQPIKHMNLDAFKQMISHGRN